MVSGKIGVKQSRQAAKSVDLTTFGLKITRATTKHAIIIIICITTMKITTTIYQEDAPFTSVIFWNFLRCVLFSHILIASRAPLHLTLALCQEEEEVEEEEEKTAHKHL